MAAKLKPYPAYKDSGLLWLEEVPKHWDLIPNRALIRKRKILVGDRHTEYRLLSLTKEGIIVRDVESGKGKFSADLGTSQEVRIGDLIFCFFDIPETPRTVGLSHYNGMITGAYTVFECSAPVLSAFLELFYKAMDDRKLLSPLYSGLRNTIPPTRFLGIKTPVPPHDEQAAIVLFLDYMDRRIRRYIHAKQKLINLLEEQKQVIIHRAVTRGLDPGVPLKPSGVEWLGDIPEHWEVVLNQRIFKEVIRPHGGKPETQLSLSQKDGLIATSEMQERSMQTSTYDNWKVTLPGDLVLNRFKAHLGVFFASTLRGIVSFHYGVFAPRRALVAEYFELLYHTNIYRTIYAGRSNGMTVGLQNLSNQNFYSVQSVVPPVHEQAEIVSFVDKSTKRLNDAVQAAHREIVLLFEYRARLISDVVTGKLDVRGIDLPAADDADVPEECSDLLDSKYVMEDLEPHEIPAEVD